MGCFPSKPDPADGGHAMVAHLQQQLQGLQQQLAACQRGGAGGAFDVLFFPDPGLPCKFGASCRRQNCTYVHHATSLTRLLQYLGSARRSLDVCVFSITCNDIAAALLECHKRGVAVRIISDNDQMVREGSDVAALRQAGIPTRIDADSAHMHHKFCVIDGRFLVNGSFNWTRAAVLQNQENIVILDNPAIAAVFHQHFNKLWAMYSGNAVPAAGALACPGLAGRGAGGNAWGGHGGH